MARILLLSACTNAGKTTACTRLVSQARRHALQVRGILALSPGSGDDPKGTIVALNLASGEERTLAEIRPDGKPRTVGRYRFDPAVLEWALGSVLEALESPCDLVIVDEIGPLELLQGGGYAPALDRLASSPARAVLLVVRRELQAALEARLRELHPVTLELAADNREGMPARLLAAVLGNE